MTPTARTERRQAEDELRAELLLNAVPNDARTVEAYALLRILEELERLNVSLGGCQKTELHICCDHGRSASGQVGVET